MAERQGGEQFRPAKHLGDYLGAARGARTQENMAAMAGVVPSTWNKWENGITIPSKSALLQVLDRCAIHQDHHETIWRYWADARRTVGLAVAVATEHSAVLIRAVQAGAVPAILRTADFAQQHLGLDQLDTSSDDQRRSRLTSDVNPVRLQVVLSLSDLTATPSPATLAQLQTLSEIAELPNVEIRVHPDQVQLQGHTFELCSAHDGSTVLLSTASTVDTKTVLNRRIVASHSATFDRFFAAALNPSTSADALRLVAHQQTIKLGLDTGPRYGLIS